MDVDSNPKSAPLSRLCLILWHPKAKFNAAKPRQLKAAWNPEDLRKNLQIHVHAEHKLELFFQNLHIRPLDQTWVTKSKAQTVQGKYMAQHELNLPQP